MKFILRLLCTIAATSVILYLTSIYGAQQLWFSIQPMDVSHIGWLLVMWVLFWLLYAIIAKIIKLFTFPLRRVTLGLSNIIINVSIFYVFQYIINEKIEVWYTIELGTIGQTVVLSCIITIVTSIVYFIIKKIV